MLSPRVAVVTGVKTRGPQVWQAPRMTEPTPDPRTAVILVAAGAGSRVGAATNKVLLPLHGVPVLAWSLRTVTALPYVDHVVVVAREEDVDAVRQVAARYLPEGREAVLVTGGPTRHASEWRGLSALRPAIEAGEVDVVAVHDGARPLADAALFTAVARAAHEHGGALPAHPQPGLVTRDGDRHVTGLVGVQTPQAFRARALLEAYTRAQADGFTGTDTASCVAAYTDLPVHAVPAPATNLKVTFAEDLALAERLLESG
jgi:2-C-methyl-D-erythritol 4-phosphate cytidylyltransferase